MEWLSFSNAAWAAVIVADVVAIARAVSRTQGVERTLAWLFAILALPGIGAIAYFALASPSVRREAARKQISAVSVRPAKDARPRIPERAAGIDGAHAHEATLLRLLETLTHLTPSAGNEVELLADDDQAFTRILNAVKSAKRSIWVEYYIVSNDTTGQRFLDQLLERARAGVDVRFLYDAVGSFGIDVKRLAAIQAAGGRVEIFLPLNPLRRRWAVHLRNHRKIVIVDGEIGFTGGMNIGDQYSGRARRKGKQHFRDTHLLLRGPAVHDLAQTFVEDWSFATDEALTLPARAPSDASTPSIVGVIPSGPDQDYNAHGLVYFTSITSARKNVYLTSPYFIPDEPTIRALQSAALRGVDVRVLVPKHNDIPIVGIAARSYFPALTAAGVRIFEYGPAMLHAKTFSIDTSFGMVGSANVDIRSFRLNFELSALVCDSRFAAELEARFLRDLESSVEVSASALEARGFLARLGDGAARLLSPLL